MFTVKYDKLWETMEQKGVTKYMLINYYHFSKALISKLQHNQGVSIYTINRLCNILECNIEDVATFYPDKDFASMYPRPRIKHELKD